MSSEIISFTVPGLPVPKGRPRFMVRGKLARVYTPDKTARYEKLVGTYGVTAMGGRYPLRNPFIICMRFVLPVPQSWPKARRIAALAGACPMMSKPDLDNLAKTVLDGLNGIVYADDCQIIEMSLTKSYGDNACTQVTLFKLEEGGTHGQG